ncbi:hypothetical protein CGC56_01430 [Capnocytophaga canimorsus]|uniref:Uncharacterized protein n=1 Tax=Capnocytophaga canimorsus TaxID=28188 RepID=A0A250G0L8_9FLAO|nr:hypothetical protein [Capnocytophaga canimorsus]ATA90949.1 hypothetical protein CGC56_01430 [Capnocytophaga canimorsus]
MELKDKTRYFVIYGLNIKGKVLYDFSTKFFQENKLNLSNISFEYIKDKKHTYKRLKLKNFENEFEMKINDFHFFQLYKSVRLKEPETINYGVFYNKEIQVLTIRFNEIYEDIYLEFVKKYITLLANICPIKYGIGYVHSNNNTYNIGDYENLGLYKEEDIFSELIFDYNKELPQLYQMGKFRHIYSINLLNNSHQKNVIDNQYLFDWISTNDYGKVQKIGNQNWLWEIDTDKLDKIGKIFQEKGLLIDVSENSALR